MADPTVIKLPKKTLVSFSPRSKEDAVVYVDKNDNGKLDAGDTRLVIKGTANGSRVIGHKVTAADIQRYGRRFGQAVREAKADRPSLKTARFKKGTCLAHLSSIWWTPAKTYTFTPNLTVSTRVTQSRELVCTKRLSKRITIRDRKCMEGIRRNRIDPKMCRTVKAETRMKVGNRPNQLVKANAGLAHIDHPLWLEAAMGHVKTPNIVNWEGQVGIHYFVGKKLFIHFAIPGNAPYSFQTNNLLQKEHRRIRTVVRIAQSFEETAKGLAKP